MKPLVCALLFAVHCAALAQVKPGSYVMNPGYGVMEITTDKTGAIKFDISVRGANLGRDRRVSTPAARLIQRPSGPASIALASAGLTPANRPHEGRRPSV